MRVMFDSKTKFLQIRHYCYMAFIVFFSFSIEKFRFTVIDDHNCVNPIAT